MDLFYNIDDRSIHFREKIIDLNKQRILISNFGGSEQEKDLQQKPNCAGYGRIRHFQRIKNSKWVENPLPIDPACKALNLSNTDLIRAQTFQIAACNLRCWFCYVPHDLLSAKIEKSKYFTQSELLDMLFDQEDPPQIIDLTGGQPELAPEWVLWMMKEIRKRKLEEDIYLWSDDNLTTDYFWRFLSPDDRRLIRDFKNYGKACCFKGLDESSFEFNTGADKRYFIEQFELMRRFLLERLDIYVYIVFTTDSCANIENRMATFVDRLQQLNSNLPLRTVPLEIVKYTPVNSRLNDLRIASLNHQHITIEAWKNELEKRFSQTELKQKIVDTQLYK